MSYPHTPDGRYFVVKGRLWRLSNPMLAPDVREQRVKDLMHARRRIKSAKQADDASALAQARAKVHEAKVALGERGPVWWDDGAKDYNRYLVKNTPYWPWYQTLDTRL